MTKEMSAEEIVQQLDALTQTQVFTPRFQRFAQSTAMPDYAPLLAELGVMENSSGAITYNNNAPMAGIRQSISANTH